MAGWLLLALVLVLPTQGIQAAEAARPYRIEACPTPVDVSITGIPELPGIKFAKSVSICGTSRRTYPIDSDVELSDEYRNSIADRLPLVRFKKNKTGLDVQIELRSEQTPRLYEAKAVASDGKSVVLKPAAADGPQLGVSVKPLDENPPYVRIHVDTVPRVRVAGDIAKIAGVKISHIERLHGSNVTFNFEVIPVLPVLQLLATDTDLEVHRAGRGAYIVGTVKDAAKIASLRKDADSFREKKDEAQLKATLERIVELAKPDPAQGLEAYIEPEYEELANVEMNGQNFARAEALSRARMAQIARFAGDTASVDYAQALADAARARWSQKDNVAAKAMLEQALAIIQKREDGDTLASARILANLAGLAIEADDMPKAMELNARAFNIVKDTTDAGFYVLRVVQSAESRIAMHFRDKEDHAAALPHWEHVVALDDKLFGENDPLTDLDREMLIISASHLGKTELITSQYEHLMRICEHREAKLQLSYACVGALHNLAAARAVSGRFEEAIALWQRVMAFRKSVFVANSPRVIAAVQDLALLRTLSGQPEQAREVAAQAAAMVPDPTDKGLPDSFNFRVRRLCDIDLAWTLTSAYENRLETEQAAASPDARLIAALKKNLAVTHAAMIDRELDASRRRRNGGTN